MPVNRMSTFDIFIGTWNTSGDVLETESAPANTLSATDTYRWLAGKHFIAHDADARFGSLPTRFMEVIGYNLMTSKYVARSYDDQGVSELFDVALEGKSWRSRATLRFNGKFNSRNDKLTGMWELKGKKAGWQPWIKLRLIRA